MPELCFAQVGQEQARLDSEDFAAGAAAKTGTPADRGSSASS